MSHKIKVAVLDDYQQVSQHYADWSIVKDATDITIFNDTITELPKLIERLLPFTIICVMRERTPLTREILSALPNLKLIVSTAPSNSSIDIDAAADFDIEVRHTQYIGNGAPELTWGLLMALARKIPLENNNFTSGKWQTTIGTDLAGKTVGIVGLGNIGSRIASYARAFDMDVIAWSDTLTPQEANRAGVRYVSKQQLFREADFISLHLILSPRSVDTVTATELNEMKPTAFLINTSRGPLINEKDLIEALEQKKIAGVALDVYEPEPLPKNHPLRKLDNVLGTPHIGYVTENTYKIFYGDTVSVIESWLDQNY